MNTFVNWAMVYIEDHTLSLIDLVDWLFVKKGEGFFLSLLHSFFLGVVCILRVYLFCHLLCVSNSSPFITYQKKMYSVKNFFF